jgi:hypothetical protein
VTFARPAEPPAALANHSSFLAFFRESAALAQVELRKLFRDPTELFTRAVQPLLWLVIFGQVSARFAASPPAKSVISRL